MPILPRSARGDPPAIVPGENMAAADEPGSMVRTCNRDIRPFSTPGAATSGRSALLGLLRLSRKRWIMAAKLNELVPVVILHEQLKSSLLRVSTRRPLRNAAVVIPRVCLQANLPELPARTALPPADFSRYGFAEPE